MSKSIKFDHSHHHMKLMKLSLHLKVHLHLRLQLHPLPPLQHVFHPLNVPVRTTLRVRVDWSLTSDILIEYANVIIIRGVQRCRARWKVGGEAAGHNGAQGREGEREQAHALC